MSNKHWGNYHASGLPTTHSKVLIYNVTLSLKINPLLPAPSLSPSLSSSLPTPTLRPSVNDAETAGDFLHGILAFIILCLEKETIPQRPWVLF